MFSSSQHRLMVETAINTDPAGAQLIALKPRHHLIKRELTVEETVVEVSIKNSPTGARMLIKLYPKDNEARTMALPADLVGQLADWIISRRLGPTICCSRPARAHRSRGTPSASASAARHQSLRRRLRRPVHDLRHAHAYWFLTGGSDLKSVIDRMGHAQITTTQKYLHTLPDADRRTSTPSTRSATLRPGSRPEPAD